MKKKYIFTLLSISLLFSACDNNKKENEEIINEFSIYRNLSLKDLDEKCNKNDGKACILSALERSEKGSKNENLEKALKDFKKAVDLKEKYSYSFLAFFYENNKHYDINSTKNELHKKGCDLNISSSCNSYAYFLETEKNDLKSALPYYEKACSINSKNEILSSSGCVSLGLIYEYGTNDFDKIIEETNDFSKPYFKKDNTGDIIQNSKTSMKYYEKGCEQGEEGSCNNLSSIYEEGIVVPQNYKKSFEILNKSDLEFDSMANYSIGLFYEYGKGDIKIDKKQALKYYKKACELDETLGCEAYKNINNENN